jgi:hypothetical protein
MNISFIGTQIEILANPLPRHRYDKLQKVFHLRQSSLHKMHSRDDYFSVFIDFR